MGRVDNLTPRKIDRHRPGDSPPSHRVRPQREYDLPLRPIDRHPRDGDRHSDRRPSVKLEQSDHVPLRHTATPPYPAADVVQRAAPSKTLKQQVTDLEHALIVRKEEIFRLNTAQYALKEVLASRTAELGRQRAKEHRHEAERKQENVESRQRNAELRRLGDENEEHIDTIRGMAKQADRMQAEMAEQQAMIESAAEIRRKDQASIAHLRQSIDTLTEQVKDRNADLKVMSETVQACARAQTGQEALDHVLNAQAMDTLHVINDLNTAREQAEAQLPLQQAAHDKKVEEFDCKIKAQASIIEQAKAKEKAASEAAKEALQALHDLQGAFRELKRDNTALKDKIKVHEEKAKQIRGLFR